MTVYILADFPFALRADGKCIAKNVNACAFSGEENTVLEVLPLDLSPARCFLPTESFFRRADAGAVKVRTSAGNFLSLSALPSRLPFTLLFQRRLNGAVLTAYSDGCWKFSAETENDYFALSLDEKIEDAGEFYCDGARFFYLYSQKKRLICLTAAPKIRKVFDAAADEFSFDTGFSTVYAYTDAAAHVCRTQWEYDGTSFRPKKTELTKRDKSACAALPNALLPYALAEAVLAGDDLSPYLSADLSEQAGRIGEYLGKFVGVFPPPKGAGTDPFLLYPETEGVYEGKALSCEISAGKIVNLTLF